MQKAAAAFATALPFALCLFIPATAWPEPPAGYYASLDPASQGALRSSIHEIIDDHIKFPYTSSDVDTWNILELADEDPEDSGRILDVYKNVSHAKVGGGNSNYNREHTWPNSYGFPDDGPTNYPYSDCHVLFLSDIDYNALRGNNPFRTCAVGCVEYPTNETNGTGGGTGTYPGNSNWGAGSGSSGSWETWIERRGDIARALFYMDIRYEGGTHGVTGAAEPNLILTDNQALIVTSGGSNASTAYMGMLSDLIAWHYQDPVDDRERHRNDVVASFQGNRNPFIDNPGLVLCALEGDCGSFYTVPPCRIADTRNADGPYGGPALTSGTPRLFTIPGSCGIPASAEAVAVNVTVVGATSSGYLTFYPGDAQPGTTAAITFPSAIARSNNAMFTLSPAGALAVQPFVGGSGQVHLIIDVSGYVD